MVKNPGQDRIPLKGDLPGWGGGGKVMAMAEQRNSLPHGGRDWTWKGRMVTKLGQSKTKHTQTCPHKTKTKRPVHHI